MNEDMQIEDILDNNIPKKKINGCRKGKSVERHLCKLLNEFFGQDANFSRSVGSGNRWSQVNLSKQAKQVYSGDICVPEDFKWVIESKGGYEDDMEIANAVDGSLPQLNKFIEQVSRDAEYTGRKPILCWKRNRKPWLACIRFEDFPSTGIEFPCRLHYNYNDDPWVMVSLDKLLKETDRAYWFETKS
jgi:hypothetical protein